MVSGCVDRWLVLVDAGRSFKAAVGNYLALAGVGCFQSVLAGVSDQLMTTNVIFKKKS